jgi:hypothetical protein
MVSPELMGINARLTGCLPELVVAPANTHADHALELQRMTGMPPGQSGIANLFGIAGRCRIGNQTFTNQKADAVMPSRRKIAPVSAVANIAIESVLNNQPGCSAIAGLTLFCLIGAESTALRTAPRGCILDNWFQLAARTGNR